MSPSPPPLLVLQSHTLATQMVKSLGKRDNVQTVYLVPKKLVCAWIFNQQVSSLQAATPSWFLFAIEILQLLPNCVMLIRVASMTCLVGASAPCHLFMAANYSKHLKECDIQFYVPYKWEWLPMAWLVATRVSFYDCQRCLASNLTWHWNPMQI